MTAPIDPITPKVNSDIPEDFAIIRDELTPEDLDKLQRLKTVMDQMETAGVRCTGRPGVIECPRWPYTCIVLHAHALALSCIECVDEVVRALFKAGHASCRQEPLGDFDVEVLRAFADQTREDNAKAGFFVIPVKR